MLIKCKTKNFCHDSWPIPVLKLTKNDKIFLVSVAPKIHQIVSPVTNFSSWGWGRAWPRTPLETCIDLQALATLQLYVMCILS